MSIDTSGAAVKPDTGSNAPFRGAWINPKGFWFQTLVWTRGVTGAVALVGTLSALPGFDTLKLLEMANAFTRVWTEVLRVLFGPLIELFGLRFSQSNLAFCCGIWMTVVMVPASTAFSAAIWREKHTLSDLLASTGFALLQVFFAYGFLFGATEQFDAIVTRFPSVTGGLGLLFALSGVALMAMTARSYFKVLLSALLFMLTLSLLYYLPIASGLITQVTAWLNQLADAQGALP